MELPIKTLHELDEFVSKLDESNCVLSRHIAIREVARLLICLTHDEHYNVVDPFDKKYDIIANACQTFVEH